MLLEPPLSLYIHFPWCVRKCPYCDFNSHTIQGNLPDEQYLKALLADLARDLCKVPQRELTSIFLGGGTPSLFSAEIIASLLQAVQQKISFAKDIEITLEANPGTVEYARFAAYRQAGVNRLSIGIQSFQKDKLKALGRIHNDAEAMRAIEAAKKAGFSNLNLDLMYGLPQQSFEDALFDLTTALSFEPSHLSWYQLNIEPNTFFAHHPPALPQDEQIWEMQQAGLAFLEEHGYFQYEISAYAKNSCYSKHNINYWNFGDYLGIGAGAHSKITQVKDNKITRMWKLKNPKAYLNSDSFIGGESAIDAQQLPFEFMLNALRLYQPIAVSLFEARTGLSIQSLEKYLKEAAAKNLLVYDSNKIEATELGRRFYNDLAGIFL